MANVWEHEVGKDRRFGVVWGSQDTEKSCSVLRSAHWTGSKACLNLQGPSPGPWELHHDAQTSLTFQPYADLKQAPGKTATVLLQGSTHTASATVGKSLQDESLRRSACS